MSLKPVQNTAPDFEPNRSCPSAVATQDRQLGASQVAKRPLDRFDRAPDAKARLFERLASVFDRKVERPFVDARDGFVAYDASGRIVGGRAGGATVRDMDLPKSPLDPLVRVLAGGEEARVTFHFANGHTIRGQTDSSGRKDLSLAVLPLQELDPTKGSLIRVGITTPDGRADEARVMALPQSYDGPILICDIDDTLRATNPLKVIAGERQKPIDGVKALLNAVAARGVPIIYLSAGPERLHTVNHEFLEQLPPGILLARAKTGLSGLSPQNHVQAREQGRYKASTIGQLKGAFPNAQLFGLGDDKFGDAMAYTHQGAVAEIRDVRPGDDNLPADFSGNLAAEYTPEFRQRVLTEIQGAVARSVSFGGKPIDRDPVARLSGELDRMTHSKVREGNAVRVLIDGARAQPEILRAIDSATQSICYESYRFRSSDETARLITDHLIEAQRRGLKVLVVADGVGSEELLWTHNDNLERMRNAGVAVQVFNPLDSVKDITLHRDHRKSIVIDGRTAFVGGMNTGNDYMGVGSTPTSRHDIMARIEGPAVKDVLADFVDTWKATGGSAISTETLSAALPGGTSGTERVRILQHTPGRDENIRAAYLALIDNAQESIYVENSFPPTDDIVDALLAATARGVKVRYIIGANEGLVGAGTIADLQALVRAGVEVFVYPHRVHTKAISTDGTFCSIGSSNVDNTSLATNREICAVIEDPSFTKKLDRELFDRDVVGDAQGHKSQRLTVDAYHSFWLRMRNAAVRMLWPESLE